MVVGHSSLTWQLRSGLNRGFLGLQQTHLTIQANKIPFQLRWNSVSIFIKCRTPLPSIWGTWLLLLKSSLEIPQSRKLRFQLQLNFGARLASVLNSATFTGSIPCPPSSQYASFLYILREKRHYANNTNKTWMLWTGGEMESSVLESCR